MDSARRTTAYHQTIQMGTFHRSMGRVWEDLALVILMVDKAARDQKLLPTAQLQGRRYLTSAGQELGRALSSLGQTAPNGEVLPAMLLYHEAEERLQEIDEALVELTQPQTPTR